MTRGIATALWLALITLLLPTFAEAQQRSEPVRIGTLLSGSPGTQGYYLTWFLEGMHDLAYVEGKDFVLVSRWGRGNRKRLPALAMELVQAKVDAMLVVGEASLRAVRKATKKIPVVVGIVANIVESGFVKSLAEPGSNITGSTFDRDALNGKRLGLLREALPDARRVAVFYTPSRRGLRDLKPTKAASKAVGFQVQTWPVRTLEDVNNAFLSMARERTDSLLIPTSALTNFHRKRIIAIAIKMRLPTMCSQQSFARAGCLMSYTVDRRPLLRRAASFIDRIIKGAKPAELPVELATRYELVVNLNTAKALAITLPPSILLQATEAIE